MSTVIASKYRTTNTDLFIDDISNSNYYVFISSTDTSETINSEYSINEFLEKTLFGKKVNPSDVYFMIDDNRWTLNTVYDQYDDRVDLSEKKFYTIVYPTDNTTGDYRVFKCLFNNYGGKSLNAPNYDPFADDQIYRMGDGYVWKHMFAITQQQYDKYADLTYVPIIGTSSTSNTIIQRSIDHIEVVNNETNKGYELRAGVIETVLDQDIIIYSTDLNLSELTNYYSGQILYVTNTNTNQSNTYVIDSYSYNVSSKRATIRVFNKNSFIQENTQFQIFPRIEISGDGAGATAIPQINEFGTIEKVLVLNRGYGYTNASARIVTPLFGFDPTAVNSTDTEAILRPILSPVGGHASNFAQELKSKRALVYVNLTNTDNLSVPSTNQYTKIGLVKNPSFNTSNVALTDIFDNRLEVNLSSNVLTVGENVSQTLGSNITFTAEVHELSGNTVFLCNYHGPFKNSGTGSDAAGYIYSDIPINVNRPIVSSQNQFLNINNSIRPPYIQKTGDVYYITSFSPITRTSSSNEEYKIVLEF
jgi:hypothetical protein